jgi:hypothetical protein
MRSEARRDVEQGVYIMSERKKKRWGWGVVTDNTLKGKHKLTAIMVPRQCPLVLQR